MSVLIFIVKFLRPVTITREINDPDLLRLFEIYLFTSLWYLTSQTDCLFSYLSECLAV